MDAAAELVRPNNCHIVKDILGIFITATVYLLLAFLYFFTMYFGNWGFAFGASPTSLRMSLFFSILHSVTYSLAFFMMLWSHF